MPTSYPAEFRRRAIAFVRSGGSVTKTAHDLDVTSTTIYNWVKRAEIQMGPRTGMTDVEREKLAALRKENYEIKRQRDSACGANFLRGGARAPVVEVGTFIDVHRSDETGGLTWGVEPICSDYRSPLPHTTR